MVNHVLTTLITVFLAVLFFSVPLVLKYHVFRPETELVIAGDVVPLRMKRVSSVWCQEVELQSDSNFYSYMFESEPKVMEGERERTVSRLDVQLQNGVQEYWGLHLLEGSKVKLRGCSQLPKAAVTLLKGQEALQECLEEQIDKLRQQQESEEDSLSESESDQGTSSISSSQGMVGNDSVSLHECGSSMYHREISSSYACHNHTLPFHHAYNLSYILTLEIRETSYYYFMLTSNTYLSIIPNQLSLEFIIDRTYYDWSSSSSNCTKDVLCRLSIPMKQPEKYVVVQTKIENGTPLREESLKVACRPREGLFLLFYAAFLIVIFLSAFH